MTHTEHLLFQLAEEAAEVAQRCSKAARFGIDEVQPGQDLNNGERISQEFADMLAVFELLHDMWPYSVKQPTEEQLAAKKIKVAKYLAYAQKCGTL